MRKILVRCQCGQEMQTPRSSIGKTGTCLACGRTMQISTRNTSPIQRRQKRGSLFRKGAIEAHASGPPPDARRRFGQAVDLFLGKRFAEALAVFDSLAAEFPRDPDIESGRDECIKAMKLQALPSADSRRLIDESELDEDTVRRVVLDKLLHGESDDVQLRAAELACVILGIDRRPGANDLRAQVSEFDRQGELDFGDLSFSTSAKPEGNGHHASPASEPDEDRVEDEHVIESKVEDKHSAD